MPDQPSATTWTRLEPQTRAQDLREGAAARVGDPAWLLARQWQFGELHGSDGGSPAAARLRLRAGVLSGYRGRGGDDDPAGWTPYDDAALPLEVMVERESAADDLRLRADGGRHFLRLLAANGAGAYRVPYTAAFALPAGVAGAPEDPDGAALLSVLAGRLPDAQALATAFATLAATPPALPAQPPVPPADAPKVIAAASAWLDWWRQLIERPAPAASQAWDPTRLEHRFALGARLGDGATTTRTLVAREYPGGSLDWYDLDVADDGTAVPAPTAGSDITRTLLPAPVRYPGMPASRFWEFENARVYLGGIEAGATDLGHMLLSEFAIVYSDDWFLIPIELPIGTAAEVASLVVSDTFGIQTLIGPAADADWRMFRLGGGSAVFVLPPVLADTLEGPPVEEVVLLRDENANVVWGVERLVESAAGRAVDRHAQWLAALRAAAEPPPAQGPWPADPPGDLRYRLRADVPPEHWIPLIPEQAPSGLRLRRSGLPIDLGGSATVPPLGAILGETQWVAAEEVPRDGVRVVRQWQLARGRDGRTHLWRARRKLAGRGEASSGLRYDVLERPDPATRDESAPAIAGDAQVGATLTAVVRQWSGTPPYTLAFQWRRCDPTGDICTDIAGATGATYRPVAADLGRTLRVRVTATAALVATSPPTALVVPAPTAPACDTPPAVGGGQRVGEQLVATAGAWAGTPPIAVARRWQRCDAAGGAAVDIAGATALTYTLAPADQGRTVRVVETATNAVGRADAASDQTAIVLPPPAPPLLQAAPAVVGTAAVGAALQATGGDWTGEPPITLSHQWQRVTPDGHATDIAGATATTYTVAAADVGAQLRVVVRARNPSGSAAATSAETATVPPPPTPPVSTAPPAIGGAAIVGQSLTVSAGTWSGTAATYGFQWRRRAAGASAWADIAGATASTYQTVAADTGATLMAVVTATNAAGRATASSAAAGPVLAPPSSTAAPSIAGTPEVGAQLTAQPGTWAGTPPIAIAYQWARFDAVRQAWSDIPGATERVYTPVATDAGARLRAGVQAANAAGSASAVSAEVTVVAPTPPRNTEAPSISGQPTAGQQLSVGLGTWSGSPITAWSFQWLRRAGVGPAVPVGTARTYLLTSEDVGSTLYAVVTASNVAGSASATSPATPAIGKATGPINSKPPSIGGSARIGATLTADPGVWSPSPTGYAFRWERCDPSGNLCVAIAGATAKTYVPRTSSTSIKLPPIGDSGDDAGATLRVVVTATNAGGSSAVASLPIGPILDSGVPPPEM